MNVDILDFNGNPNIGLYLFATNKYCLIPENTPEKISKKVSSVLDVDVLRINIAGTSLLGALLSGNEHTLLVPEIAFETELQKLKDYHINFSVLPTELTALGNNIIIGKKGIIINPNYTHEVSTKLQELFDLGVMKKEFNIVQTPGSVIKLNNQGLLISSLIEDKARWIKRFLGFESFETTSVNFGNPYISSGIIVNDKGLLIGKLTTGFESMQIQRGLGFTRY